MLGIASGFALLLTSGAGCVGRLLLTFDDQAVLAQLLHPLVMVVGCSSLNTPQAIRYTYLTGRPP